MDYVTAGSVPIVRLSIPIRGAGSQPSPLNFHKIIRLMANLLKEIYEKSSTHYLMKNASPSEKDDGSMIAYWEDKTKIKIGDEGWTCPKCGRTLKRSHLDGAHVVYAMLEKNHPQYITPLCQTCNRKGDEKSFWVRKEYVVPAP